MGVEPGLVRRVGPTVGVERVRGPETPRKSTETGPKCSVLEAAVRRTIVCESKCRKKLHTRSETTLEETRRCSEDGNLHYAHEMPPVRHTRACTVLPYARRVMLSDHQPGQDISRGDSGMP